MSDRPADDPNRDQTLLEFARTNPLTRRPLVTTRTVTTTQSSTASVEFPTALHCYTVGRNTLERSAVKSSTRRKPARTGLNDAYQIKSNDRRPRRVFTRRGWLKPCLIWSSTKPNGLTRGFWSQPAAVAISSSPFFAASLRRWKSQIRPIRIERRHFALLALMCLRCGVVAGQHCRMPRQRARNCSPSILAFDDGDAHYRAASYVLSQNVVHGDALTMRNNTGEPSPLPMGLARRRRVYAPGFPASMCSPAWPKSTPRRVRCSTNTRFSRPCAPMNR